MSRLWAETASIPVRRLSRDDLPACLDLAADRGWPREDHKWRLLFDIGEVYGITDPDGALVAASVLTRYGWDLCAISMVLVAARHDGLGLGRRMMSDVLSRTGDAVVTLYATSLGLPLYEKLGFTAVSENVTHVGGFDGPRPAMRSRRATGADLPVLTSLDAEVHGSDRGALVRQLPIFCSQLRVIETNGRVTGYAGAWDNLDTVMAGPLVAAGVDDAQALIADLSHAITAPIRLEVLRECDELGTWATDHGMAPGSTTTLMVHDGRRLPGDARRRFSPVSVALG